ncbi:MAG: hypothetical protein H7123_01435 [Thermoleophilia bacterium]|nr:hypothetical protein [Thermoleophilia bacterium]
MRISRPRLVGSLVTGALAVTVAFSTQFTSLSHLYDVARSASPSAGASALRVPEELGRQVNRHLVSNLRPTTTTSRSRTAAPGEPGGPAVPAPATSPGAPTPDQLRALTVTQKQQLLLTPRTWNGIGVRIDKVELQYETTIPKSLFMPAQHSNPGNHFLIVTMHATATREIAHDPFCNSYIKTRETGIRSADISSGMYLGFCGGKVYHGPFLAHLVYIVPVRYHLTGLLLWYTDTYDEIRHPKLIYPLAGVPITTVN